MESVVNRPSFQRTCWICGMAVTLETCKVDEHGLAVHEECQVLKLLLRNPESGHSFRAPASRPTTTPRRPGHSQAA